MSQEMPAIIAGMAAVTYATRSLPLLAPGADRLPPLVLAYLRHVGPAILAALVAGSVALASGVDGRPSLHVGIEWLAVAACAAVVARSRVLIAGLAVAVAIVVAGRAAGLG